MRKISYRPYLFLIFCLFAALSLPEGTTDRLRSTTIASLAPCSRFLIALKELAVAPHSVKRESLSDPAEIERLHQENLLLRAQIENVREWLLNEDRLQELVEKVKEVASKQVDAKEDRAFLLRRNQDLVAQLDLTLHALPAKVIVRDPSSWSSSLWIDVGERENRVLGKKVVAKNSPVLFGTTLVGVVEQVSEKQSRVRLVTDARLMPSVRAVRGKEQNRFLLEHLDALLFALEAREDLISIPDSLLKLKQLLQQPMQESYLAKGILAGTQRSHFRTRSQVLRGVGFNADFADREGPARDLRNGVPYGSRNSASSVAILKTGDLLVTTGLDGVFPAGLRVGIVTHVEPLKEGASSYEIEARSTAGNLDELTHLVVLPPL